MIGILRCGENTDMRRPSMMQAYVVTSIVSQYDTSCAAARARMTASGIAL